MCCRSEGSRGTASARTRRPRLLAWRGSLVAMGPVNPVLTLPGAAATEDLEPDIDARNRMTRLTAVLGVAEMDDDDDFGECAHCACVT